MLLQANARIVCQSLTDILHLLALAATALITQLGGSTSDATSRYCDKLHTVQVLPTSTLRRLISPPVDLRYRSCCDIPMEGPAGIPNEIGSREVRDPFLQLLCLVVVPVFARGEKYKFNVVLYF